MAAPKSQLFVVFTNLSRRGRFVLFIAFLVVFFLVLQKVRYSDLVNGEPVFRRAPKRLRSSDDEFCLVSYNILADSAVKRWPQGYMPLSMKDKLRGPNAKSSLRHKQLMKELEWLKPDIINMQEVETAYFSLLTEELGWLGYDGVHQPHRKGLNGLATFYRASKFELKKSGHRDFNDLLAQIFGDLSIFENRNLHNQRVVLFTHLFERERGKSIVVANLHSMFDSWRRPDMQALQITSFLRELHKFVASEAAEEKALRKKAEKMTKIPWIISGDFNTYPHFPLYNIISTGNVSDDDMKLLNPNKYKYPQVVRKSQIKDDKTVILQKGREYLSHPLSDIRSAYKTLLGREPLLTHYQKNKEFPEVYGFEVMKGTLDYIWYSSATLEVNSILQHVREKVIKPLVACPNKYFPSDHLSMKACFSFA